VARAAINVVRPAADAKGISLDYCAEPGLGAISADSARLHQIIWNLLSNAVKFTPHGGKIFVRVEQRRIRCTCDGEDTGQGIDSSFCRACSIDFVRRTVPRREVLVVGTRTGDRATSRRASWRHCVSAKRRRNKGATFTRLSAAGRSRGAGCQLLKASCRNLRFARWFASVAR
jgi:signal transduction histidine kinase